MLCGTAHNAADASEGRRGASGKGTCYAVRLTKQRARRRGSVGDARREDMLCGTAHKAATQARASKTTQLRGMAGMPRE